MSNEPLREAAPTTPDDLQWHRSYDRASVDRFLAEVEVERERLQTDIRMVRERVVAQERVVAEREREGLAAIGALAVAARDQLTRIESEHRAIIATIEDAAAMESARVLAAAHREAEAMRASTTSLAGKVVAEESHPPASGPGGRGHADAG